MPLFDFKCPKCGAEREEKVPYSDFPVSCMAEVGHTFRPDGGLNSISLCSGWMERVFRPGGATLLKGLDNTKG